MLTVLNCSSPKEEKSKYQNIASSEASYVGMNTCKTCHSNIYESYMQTGMGQSWDLATRKKSAADFSTSKALVYDSFKNLYYKPYWQDDSLYILEYRLLANDTIHKRIEKVSYIVGSGQHTNSHIININGYLHQAPITFYTQKGKWDLAPGFENGTNTRFDRKIELECITCHNGYPEFVNGSLNKYTQLKSGIDCERCHGPGSLHVADKQAGNIIDTANAIDYTIVNPKKLSTEAQNNLCQRCHLQGVSVLQDDKTFFDFKPSETLNKTMHVFMPVHSQDEENMIMASHVERMKLSKCFINSGKMSCITCHNPHVSVKFTPPSQYNTACQKCHASSNDCKEDIKVRNPASNNCVSCHMPKNKSIDIPHVAVTDHYIRRKKVELPVKSSIAKFIQMKCYNDEKPSYRVRAKAFLEFYERYETQTFLLDSAIQYLKKADTKKGIDDDLLRTYYLYKKFDKVIELSKSSEISNIPQSWTCYRIGESFHALKQLEKSVPYYERAVMLKPLYLDFQNKLGEAYLDINQIEKAKKVFQFIVNENPKYANAQASLGYIFMEEKNWINATKHLQEAIRLDPNLSQSMLNLAVVYYQTNQNKFIKPLLKHVLLLDATNEQAKAMLVEIESL